MKYIKSYKIFESSNGLTKYYIPGKHWDYQLGDIWSPKVLIGNNDPSDNRSSNYGRNDSHVNKVEIKDNGGSNSLANRAVMSLFPECFGTSNLNELCEFHLQDLGYDYGPKDEFSFLEKGLIEKRCYIYIKVPGKEDIIQQVPSFKGRHYLDIVGDIIGHTFTDSEKKDATNGKDNKYYGGSWHISVGLYDVNGIKIISAGFDRSPSYIIKRSDLEKLIDMTSSYNFYRFEDKGEQLLRIGGKRLEYNDIMDIFVDVMDIDTNKITMEDFHQINENQIMIKFMTTNMLFDKELVDELKDNISRFSNAYGFGFDRIDLTMNPLMYVNDPNKTWMSSDKPTHGYKDLDKLMEIGEMEYNLHTRKHAMYIIFNI